MSKKVLSQTITKSQALDGIGTILQNFNNLIIELNWDLPKTNYTELKKFADYMTDEGYLESFRTIPYQTVLDNVDTEGYLELITKCGKLSKLYGLDVEVPENVEVLGEGVVEDFLEELTQYSLNTLNNNKTELTKTYNELLLQTDQLDLKDSKQTPLEEIILKSREYKIAKRNADNASTELMNMAASAGSGASYDEKEYVRYQQIYNSNTAEMDYIKRNYPLVTFFNGKEDKKTVEKQLGKAYKEINKALDNLIARIHDGKYPIWHFDTLAEQLLEKYEDKDRTVIQNELARMKKKEELTDLLLTIGPMVLSVGLFLIPGGASFILLGLKAGLQVANAAVGVMSAVNDIQDAAIMKDESYASLKISPEIKQLMNKENYDINDAKFQYIVALVSSGFVVFDVMDAVDAFKLIKKCGQLDDVTRNALKQSKRFGEKAFKNVDNITLNKIGKAEKATKVFDNLAILKVEEIPKALNYFPDNLNKNIIWLSIVDKPADVISEVKYTEVFEELAKRAEILTNADPKAIEKYLSSVNKAFTQEELVIVSKVKDGTNLPEIGVRLQSGAYNGFCKNEDIQQVFFTKLDEIAGKSYDGGRTPVENLMKRLGFTDEDVAKNMRIFDNPDGRMYLDVVVSRDKSVFKTVNWDDVEDRFIKYVNSMDKRTKDFKLFRKKYNDIFDGNVINRKQLEELYFNAFKSKEATKSGFSALNELQTNFFNEVIYNKFNINKYYTGQGFTATIDEKVFGTGEMVLESTGKETLPLSNKNYMTYRYSVDKDCNIKLYNVYD